MRKIVVLIIVSLFLVGCGSKSNSLEEIIKEGNYIIVDVRTKEEYAELHVKEAINIPYDEIDENISLDKDKKILVYCKSGKRSKIAYDTLTNLGYDVIDLKAFSSINLPKE